MEKSSGERVVRGMLCFSTWRRGTWLSGDSRDIYGGVDEDRRKKYESLLDEKMGRP